MRKRIKTVPYFAAGAVGVLAFLLSHTGQAQDPFGQVTERISPLEPLEQPPPPPPPSPTVPPPEARTPVNQRIEQIQDNAFTILPENMPLPQSTISKEILLGEKPKPAPVVPRNDQQNQGKPQEMELLARVMQGEDGAPVLRLAGLSPGHMATWHDLAADEPATQSLAQAKQAEQPKQKPAPEKSSTKAAHLAVKKHQLTLTYAFDEETPEERTRLTSFMEDLAATSGPIKQVRAAVHVQKPPLAQDIQQLGKNRWQWLARQLGAQHEALPAASLVIVTSPAGQAQTLHLEIETHRP